MGDVDDRDSEESDWSDCPELEEDEEVAYALFASFKGRPLDCLKADQSLNGWNLKSTGSKNKFDFLDFIKAVNFIRSGHASMTEAPEKLTVPLTMSETEFLNLREKWSSDEYLKPADQSDAFLCFDWDGMTIEETTETDTDSNAHGKETEIDEKRRKMEEIRKEIENVEMPSNITKDDGYFDSYSDYSIHAEMLQDRVRTEAYRDTIYKNSKIIRGKKVVDIGAGTGILSMFAAKSGADHVYSCEMAEIAYDCIDIIRENNLQDKITVLKGKAENQFEKIKNCDVIISEWMGYCLLFEGMLDSVINLRDKILKPDGYMIPATANIEICLMNNSELWDYYNGFWGDVYGFKMNSMKKKTKHEAHVTVMHKEHVASKMQELIKWDLKTCSVDDLSFESNINLRAKESGEIHGLIASFDCEMIDKTAADEQLILSTSPLEPPTHWKQTGFLIKTPVMVEKDDIITGNFSMRRNHKNERELRVFIKLCHKNVTICDQEYNVA